MEKYGGDDMNRPDRQINILMVGLLYFGFFFFAVLMHMEESVFRFPPLGLGFWPQVGLDVLIGSVVAILVVLGTHLAVRFFAPMKELARDFTQMIGPLGHGDIFFLSIFSALGEEFFFRGYIQGKIGLVFASLIFGLLHIGPTRRFAIWTIFATGIGFLLGLIYEWRGDLFAPVVAHFLINFCNLLSLNRSSRAESPST